ncbi:ternary complex factor MIP1 leucine-zipper protein (Protein of unknown function, DUF547) [Thalictrum thalictroides]|uniref:Uncharacterized protein n=1 Tax=Thalictrum thalictroides TaxID=46969 RepID=A0A7J6UYN3_THATH|nr:ternary complex factor MIP1 leucine-zipper protein (Protein of unknown function, DUF547) [Thalictrum thalictroides]
MNNRATTMVHTLKSPMKLDKEEKIDKKQGSRLMDSQKGRIISRRCSNRERKLALLEDVDKLKKKLRHEENVHRALERAFTRPLGALPRLPPYLPSYTLELLAEVAVLEEEVVYLEEQIVNFRKGLYEEVANNSSSKRIKENPTDLYNNKKDQSHSPTFVYENTATLADGSVPRLTRNRSIRSTNEKQTLKRDQLISPSFVCENSATLVADSTQLVPRLSRDRSTRSTNGNQPLKRAHCSEDGRGKDNQSCIDTARKNKQSPKQPAQISSTPVKGASMAQSSKEKHLDSLKPELESRTVDQYIADASSLVMAQEKASEGEGNSPNKISEDILKCLSSIFLRMSTQKNRNSDSGISFPLMQTTSLENNTETELHDPYGICKDLRKRDIGLYKHLCSIEAKTIDAHRMTNSLFLIQRLKILLGKLASVELKGLKHQQKLAFWINIYNSCMMNAFLENGIPESPQKVVALMQKAMINVGGQSLNAMTIEHFILRLPHLTKSVCSEGNTTDEMKQLSVFGLEWSEPLVTFALSCGSWSSPAVRVYTASQVENELEAAKKNYLQAAVGISSSNKLVIPKLLDWYLLDFAKNLESLVDWICLQLPSDLRNEASRYLERGKGEPLTQSVQVVPYDFSFRYLLHE